MIAMLTHFVSDHSEEIWRVAISGVFVCVAAKIVVPEESQARWRDGVHATVGALMSRIYSSVASVRRPN